MLGTRPQGAPVVWTITRHGSAAADSWLSARIHRGRTAAAGAPEGPARPAHPTLGRRRSGLSWPTGL